MRLKKKMLGIILSLVLALGLMPGMRLTAYAANYENGQSTTYRSIEVGDTFEAGAVIGQDSGQMWSFSVYVDGNLQGKYFSTPYTVTNTLKLTEKKNAGLYFSSIAVGVENVSLNHSSLTLDVGGTYDGFVVDITPTDATDKTVTWSSDNELVATVDNNGKVTAVAAGSATITATATNGTEDTSDDKTATCAVKVNTDTSAKVPYDDVPISTGSVKDITGTAAATAESNPFETKIENNSNLNTLLSLTDAEVAQGVNVWLDVQDMSASVPQTDKTLIQDKSGDYTVGLYLDINLFKKVGSNDATKVSETNGKVKASIVIPEGLRKSGRTFEIIRVHDGVASAIEGTYDENTHVFTFETDKFSTYALAYKDSAVAGGNSTLPTSPKTGDTNDVRVWYLLLIASFGGLGFLELSKKKED